MKKYSLLLAFSFCFLFSRAQSFKKVAISNSGCSLYTFCELKIDVDYSEDSSQVYVGECAKDGVDYGVICVKLIHPMDDLDAAEESMISYLDYLKTSFKILKAAGYGRGHRLGKEENTRGVIDYWEDADKNNWKIKGWADGKYIGILYAYSPKELNETKVNFFLDGFRFPWM
jgi:hypothetical protein